MAIGGTFYAFDLGRLAGWCKGQPGDPPVSGSYTLYRASEGIEQGFANLIAILAEMFEEDRPTAVFCAVPFTPKATQDKGSSTASLKSVLGYRGILAGMAGRFGAHYKEVPEATARKHFLGKGRLGKLDKELGLDIKDLVLERCRLVDAMPRSSTDGDRADAICIWSWAVEAYGGHSKLTTQKLYFYGETANEAGNGKAKRNGRRPRARVITPGGGLV